jgi:hypothetical protein
VEREWLAREIEAGKSLEQIARDAGRHASTIGYWAGRYGLRTSGAGRYAARGAPRPPETRGARQIRASAARYCGGARPLGVHRALLREGAAGSAAMTAAWQPSNSTTWNQPPSSSRCRCKESRAGWPEPGRRPRSAYCCAPTATLRWRRDTGSWTRPELQLPGVDSNHQELINSQSCCRYITGDRQREDSAASGASGLVGRPRQAPRSARRLQHRERLGLDLAHSLAGHADLMANVLQGHRALVAEAVAQLDHAALAPRQ